MTSRNNNKRGHNGAQAEMKSTTNEEHPNKRQHCLDLVGILEGDVGDCILGFLNRRELFNMTFTSKGMMKKLSYKNIVRSGMMHPYSKTTVERIVQNLDKIYIPSPLRFLRMINGKFCERCKTTKVQQVFGPYGVYMCQKGCLEWGCLVHSRDHLGEDKKNLVLSEPVSHHFRGSSSSLSRPLCLWKTPWTNDAGENSGPLVSCADVQQLDGRAAIQELIRQRRSADPNRQAVDKIKEAYEASLLEGKRREDVRRQIRQAKSAKAAANRLKKIQDVIAKLSACIDDGKEWKDVALRHEWRDSLYKGALTKTPIFKIIKIHCWLRDFIETPRKATTPLLSALAERITEIFDRVYEKKYFQLPFLSNDKFEEKLRDTILEHGGHSLRDLFVDIAVSAVWDALQSQKNPPDKPSDIEQEIKDEIMDQLLGYHGRVPWDVPGILLSMNIPESRTELAELLARGLWGNPCRPRSALLAYYKQCCTALFPNLFRNACSFMEHKADEKDRRIFGLGDFADNDAFLWSDPKMIDLLSSSDQYSFSDVRETACLLQLRRRRMEAARNR